MPTYEYQCEKCRHKFELFQSMKAEPVKKCPKCKGKVRRLLGAGAGIIFKGSGFYETDYKKAGRKSGGGSASSDSAKSSDSPKTSDSSKPGDAAKSGDSAKSSDSAKSTNTKSSDKKSGS